MKTFYILIIVATFFHLNHCSNVTISLNPGCEDAKLPNGTHCQSRKLGYAIYPKNETSYHYILDLDQTNVLSLLVIQTPPSDKTTTDPINWPSLFKGEINSISFKNTTDAIGLVFSDLILEECDKDGNGLKNTTLPMKKFTTFANVIPRGDSAEMNITFIYNDPAINGTKFSMNLNFIMNNQTSRPHRPPALLYDVGSIHAECTFTNDLPIVKNKTNIILSLDLIQFGNFSSSERKIISDEHSPGVFSLFTFSSVNKTTVGDAKSFLQFRSVAYFRRDHGASSTLEVYPTPTNVSAEWNKSAAFGYFSGQRDVAHHPYTFKLNTHEVYSKDNYTSFSFVLGVGEPPQDKLSTTLNLFIIIGFGIPILALLATVLYFGTKKIMQVIQTRRENRSQLIPESDN